MEELSSDYWSRKKVLVTGADGFVGSWLTKKLVELGSEVVIIRRDIIAPDKLGLLGVNNQFHIVNGDLTNYELVQRIISEYEIEICFHLAAQAIVGIANKSPLSTFNSNIKGTWNVLESCRNSQTIRSVVVATSDKVYGDQKELPLKEDHSLKGLYPYDASKVCADVISQSYAKTYGLPVCIARCSNIYGGADFNFSRFIPDAIRCLLQGTDFVIRSDGTYERDYLYVDDAINGYIKLAENIEKNGIKGEAFNFGTESPINVLHLFDKISQVMGTISKPKVLGTAKNEINKQYLCTNKARTLLGWTPKYSLKEGIKETVKWYSNHFNC